MSVNSSDSSGEGLPDGIEMAPGRVWACLQCGTPFAHGHNELVERHMDWHRRIEQSLAGGAPRG